MTQDAITNAVIEDLVRRSEIGVKKYNTTLGQNNKDDFMNHLYEELLDAAQYIKKEQSFIPTIQKLIYDTPDNQELGDIIRRLYGKKSLQRPIPPPTRMLWEGENPNRKK
jgi:hypothetical protein